MSTSLNRQIILASRPQGQASLSNFQMVSQSIPSIKEGEVLAKTLYLSVDPYMRHRMNDKPSYIEPFQINRPITGGVIGKVIQSNISTLQPGDFVLGFSDWADYFIGRGNELEKINLPEQSLSTALGILGMPGMTAYFGLMDIGKPKAGETLIVSAAGGAVGSLVGQIGKIQGCNVVGIAGTEDKIDYLKNELKFEAINYKNPDFLEKLAQATPKGVDVYFDNVGGVITDAVLKRINRHSRIVICGQISTYNLEKEDVGPRSFPQLLVKSSLAQGFIINQYEKRFPEGRTQITTWLEEGKLKYQENIVIDLENAPKAFLGLFIGENKGKQLVKVS